MLVSKRIKLRIPQRRKGVGFSVCCRGYHQMIRPARTSVTWDLSKCGLIVKDVIVSSRNHEELGHAAPHRIRVWGVGLSTVGTGTPEPTVGKAGGGLGPEIFHQTLHSVHDRGLDPDLEDSGMECGTAAGICHGCGHQPAPVRMSLILTVPFIYFCCGPDFSVPTGHGYRRS